MIKEMDDGPSDNFVEVVKDIDMDSEKIKTKAGALLNSDLMQEKVAPQHYFIFNENISKEHDLESQEQFSVQHTAGFEIAESEIMSDYGSTHARISMQSGIRSTPVTDFVPHHLNNL